MSGGGETPSSPERIGFWQKCAFGVGIIPNGIMGNSIFMLAIPIFSIGMGVNPAWMGIGIMVSKVWDAITDPFVGNISDNLRTRWGRRRPLMLAGAVTGALFFVLLWVPDPEWSSVALLSWFIALTILLNTALTVYIVPYNGLSYELSYDYNERTRIMSYRAWFQAISSLMVGWMYKAAFAGTDPEFSRAARFLLGDETGQWLVGLFGQNEVEGVRTVGLLAAVVIVVTGSIPVLFLREKREATVQARISLFKAFRYTVDNKPFLIVCGIIFFTLTGIYLVHPLGQYIGIFYIYEGDRSAAGTLMGLASTAWTVTTLLLVPLIGWLGTRFGKRRTLMGALALILVANLLQWWMYDPEYPWLAVLNQAMLAPGIAAIWVMESSMVGDVTDLDEYKHGLRREAMFGAVHSWIFKGGTALALGLSGFVVSYTRVDVDRVGPQDPDTVLKLRLLFIFIPALFSAIALLLAYFYPITRERALETRRLIEERKAAQGACGAVAPEER